MNPELRPLTAEEQTYTYQQSQQIAAQTGLIGYLRGDFGKNGEEFYTAWFDQLSGRKTEAFRAELDEVINALRFPVDGKGLLQSRAAMAHFCRDNPESKSPEQDYTFGFRAGTAQYAYLLRCSPAPGDYNFYCWCYEALWLDRHIGNARQGIRFIDSNYHLKFRIPDGAAIRITRRDGTSVDRICRYIDETHVEVGRQLYHICEFAEGLERSNARLEPLCDKIEKSHEKDERNLGSAR